MIDRILTATAVVLVLAATAPAFAAEPADDLRCFERTGLVAHLQAEYGETQQSIGYLEGRGLVELFANDASGSWTLLLTPHEEASCILRTGLRDEAAGAESEI